MATRVIFLLAMVMRLFKIVASPERRKNRMWSHSRTGDAIAEKIAEKNRANFNELNFLRQNRGLCRQV